MKTIAMVSMSVFISVYVYAADRILVKTAKISEVAIHPEYSAPATVVSLNESVISARIATIVDELTVRVGDIVEKGDVLAQLDCEDYALSYRESVARLEALQSKRDLAKSYLERTRRLTLKQSVAEEILDERESEYAVLGSELKGIRAEIKMKKLDQSYCTVVSPFRALVIERTSAVGEFVKVGTALVKVMDMGNTEISAQVSSRDSAQVNNANELFFEYDNIRTVVKLRTIVQAINTETRNREARLTLLNSQVLPGTTGKLIWRDKRAYLPSNLLVRRDGKLGVFIIEANIAHFSPMPTAQAGRASATSLEDNSHIVIEGHFSLKESAPVYIIN